MLGCKFEVGKTYRCTTGVIAKCLYAYDNGQYHCMVGEIISGGHVGLKTNFSGEAWSEHKVPRTLTFFVNIYENPDGTLRAGTVWGTREKALASIPRNTDCIDTMEVTWTEKTDG